MKPAMRQAIFVVLALAGCHHRAPSMIEIAPDDGCAGQLMLEFTNRLAAPVEVGWIVESQLDGVAAQADPVSLGVAGEETTLFEVPGPGRVIFRTANPASATEDRHHVSHRLLCRAP